MDLLGVLFGGAVLFTTGVMFAERYNVRIRRATNKAYHDGVVEGMRRYRVETFGGSWDGSLEPARRLEFIGTETPGAVEGEKQAPLREIDAERFMRELRETGRAKTYIGERAEYKNGLQKEAAGD